MAANTAPIFTLLGQVSADSGVSPTAAMAQLITAANNDYIGTNAAARVVFTADPTNGSYISKLRFKPSGTNVQTVARIYINNGGATTTAANNAFFGEISLPLITASAVIATAELDYSLGFALNPGFRIVVCLATAVAAGWVVTGIGGDY